MQRSLGVKIFFRLITKIVSVRKFFRINYFRALGATIGDDVSLGNIDMSLPEQVLINRMCKIEDNVRFRPGGQWKQSSIEIGENTFVGHSTQINVGSKFKIGKNCLIAPMCVFSDAHHTFDNVDIPICDQETTYLPINVEDNVWIGSGVVVLGGVTIHTGAVVAAGAVVNKSIPANEIWGGVPAKKIKSRFQ